MCEKQNIPSTRKQTQKWSLLEMKTKTNEKEQYGSLTDTLQSTESAV